MSNELKTIPPNAIKLIEAWDGGFVQRKTTLWEYRDGAKDKYVIDYNGKITEESSEEVIDWINNILTNEECDYTCYGIDILVFKQYLSYLKGDNQ